MSSTDLPVPAMNKVIVPTEVKVCATCTFWDGERTVDSELGLVVVCPDGQGECLVQTKCSHGLNDVRGESVHCAWEHLAPDQPSPEAEA